MTSLLPRISCLVLCVLCAVRGLPAEMSSAEAVATLLNSRNAVGVRKFEAAREIVARDARAGKPLQQFVLGVTTDGELAAQYLDASRERIRQLAEKNGNPLAWYLLSLEKNDFTCLKKAADGGNVQALNALGAIVTQEALARSQISSNALEALLRKSYGYFRQAAIKRDPNGFINLGTCYLRGFGCKRDMGLAFVCFKAAADAGHPEGMDNVSACYQFGHGVERNAELSLLWAMRGRAARGDEAAAKWLRERK
ncbi:MAG: tetratricopeptide repeat protein [Kiritimatiellia bacterium]